MEFWLSLRYLTNSSRFLNRTALFALTGLIIGVAILVLSISILNGVETYLKKAVIDTTGHMMVIDRFGTSDPMGKTLTELKEASPGIISATPFIHLDATIVKKRKISGIVIEGIHMETLPEVLNFQERLIQGTFDVSDDSAVLGKVIAKNFNLKVGDTFQIILPKPQKINSRSFSPKHKKFKVSGILDLGKYEFNERYVVISDTSAQFLAEVGKMYSGLRLKYADPDFARGESLKIMEAASDRYWAKDWFDVSYNFFSAIQIEKRVIFVVLLSMIFIAAFNLSSTLFVSVFTKFSDIGILKTMGLGPKRLKRLFIFQGLFIAFLGSFIGIAMGMLSAWVISQSVWIEIPAEIYKFDQLPVDFRIVDLVSIFMVSLGICFLSTLLPARKGALLSPVKGLRYE